MATKLAFDDRELLGRFRETYPELSIYQIADIGEDEFVERYAEALTCDPWQARRVHRAAAEIKEQVALIWANLKEAASPHLKQTLFNNIPPEFLEHLQSIPGYDRLFGSLDFIDCDHARSIFGPAAYFVDLMRFVETNITRKIPVGVSAELKLEQRRPDLVKIKLDKDNTFDLIPYIDLVIEMLEAVIRSKENPDTYQMVEAAGFPMTLPFNLPLAEIRSYLSQLETNLHDIYQTFRTAQSPADHFDREFLDLSPKEYRLISTAITDLQELANYYGGYGLKPVFQLTADTLDDLRTVGLPASILTDLHAAKNARFEGPDAEQALLKRLQQEIGANAVKDHGAAILTWANRRLSKVQMFLAQTGLTRSELNDLIYQDLDRHEINAGLSRLFFINNVEDGQGHLMIEQESAYPNDPSYDTEHLVNLSPQKLDRIYRFLKLARRLNWSFADLDWAIRSLHQPYAPESSLNFDGVNEYVACPKVNKTLVRGTFTLEAWVNPARHGLNPIISKGDAADQQNHQTHFLFWIDAEGRLAYYDKQLLDRGQDAYLRSLPSIPTGQFSHVAVTVSSLKEVEFYINGKSSQVAGPNILSRVPATIGTDLEIGRNLGECYFVGIIKEVRLWDTVRTQALLEANRYRRLIGRETHLVGYWPLLEDRSGRLIDYSSSANHGLLGADGFVTQPTWVQRDLVLDPMPVAMRFSGLDQYLAAVEVKGFDQERTILTLEAWLKIIDLNRDNVVICQGNAAGQKTQFLFGVNPEGELFFESSSIDTGFKSISKIKAEELTHVCVTLSEQAVTFYINGALDKAYTLAAAAKLLPQGQDLYLGRDFASATFNGLIKEVRVWDIARTVEQIVQDKDHPLVPYEHEGLIGYWQLDEIDTLTLNGSQRAVAEDRSATQNHLHLGGVLEDYMPSLVSLIDLPAATPVATTGTVLTFDGENDVITIFDAENTGLGQFERWTLAFWFKPAFVDQPGRHQVLFIQGDTEAGLRVFIEEGLKIAVWSGDYEAPDLKESVIELDGLNAGQWYHLAVTNNGVAAPDAVDLMAYLDGELIGQITIAENFTFSPIGAAYLGGLGRTPGQTRIAGKAVDKTESHHLHHFAGQVADLRFWRVVKEAMDIKRERYIAPDPTAEDLVVYLPLYEGHGVTFRDQSRSHDPCLPPDHEGRFQTRNVALVNDGINADLENIYSHYTPQGIDVLGWQNYVYTGRLRLTDADGGIGLTFYSRYPDRQAGCYQLRRVQNPPNFHFTAQPYDQKILSGPKTTSTLSPAAHTWYRFKVEVETGVNETGLKAKIWPDGGVEPDTYDLEAVDDRAEHLTSGTVGLLAFGPGEKQFDDLEVRINGQTQLLPANSFEAYGSDQDPTGWHDTSVRVYHDIEADLFRTHMVEQKRVFGTDSELTNIHAHYHPRDGSVDFESWTGYDYTGRMLLTDDEGGIGVTFFSQYPRGKDQYYRLRRSSRKRNFHLASHSARIGGKENVDEMAIGAKAKPNIWYRFRIRVQYDPKHSSRPSRKGATHIQANVWEDGTPEPKQFEIDVFDASDPITSGTIGVWSMAKGKKYFDDLMVTSTTAPGVATLLEEDFEHYDHDQDPDSWRSTGQNNRRTEEPGLFRVILSGNPLLGPARHLTSDDENLHTHYIPVGVDVLSWQNYVYTGRMYVADETSGIGVTFYSRYPERRDEYYRLHRSQQQAAFHLSPHPEGIHLLGGDKANADVPTEADTWYRFYIEVKTVEASGGTGQTSIQAKLWQDGDPEPAEFQIEAIDSGANRLTSGTVGVWADAAGPVYVDDLRVWREMLLDEDFGLYNEGQTPNNWQDTGASHSTEAETGLFKILRLNDNLVFGTDSILDNIHSHFFPTEVEVSTLSDYRFTGRMRLSDDNGGLGVTFFSGFPDEAFYYRLGRPAEPNADFQLTSYPESGPESRHISKVIKDKRVKAEVDSWYRFLIEAVHDPDDLRGKRFGNVGATTFKAKIWKEGEPEPAEFQYQAADYSSPITFGTVGVWASGSGGKYFDDLKVSHTEVLLDEDFAGYGIDQKPEGWRDTKSRSRFELDDALFKTKEFDDNTPHWLSTDEYPLWLNPLAMQFDGRQQYLAAANIVADPPVAFTIEAWVQPTAIQPNPIVSHGNSLMRHPKFWFGLNKAGKLALTGLDDTGAAYAVSGSAEIPTDQFSHVAVSVDAATVSFYLAGRPDGDPQTLQPPVMLSGPDVEIGRNLANEQFSGYIREVRLWQGVRLPEQIAAGRYQSGVKLLTGQGGDLISYWPLLQNDQGLPYWSSPQTTRTGAVSEGLLYALDAADAHHLRRGGLAGARQPDLVQATWQPEQGFWQTDRRVLAFNGPNDIIHWQGSATDEQRRRRAIAIWFRVEDKTVSTRKQVIYREGDEHRGLLIYAYAGCLYFGGYSGVVWPGTWLETDRIESMRWHQAVIVLDGRPDLRRGAFQACLDGKLIDVGHGAQLGDYPHNLTLGGIVGPVRFHDGPTAATDSSHDFRGQMMELAIWNTSFTPAEVSKLREAQLTSKKVSQKPKNLVLGWQFEQADLDQKRLPNTAGGSQAVKINPQTLRVNPHHSGLQPLDPVLIYQLPHTDLATDTLAGLARIKKLLERYRLSMDRLTALWFGPKHMGREDQRTLFDQVFNAQHGADQPWSYYLESLRWNVVGQGNLVEDRAVRSRLMGALRLTDGNLSQLVATLSGPETGLIVLDGAYLNRLYRLTNTPRTLQLNLAGYTRLLALLSLKDIDNMGALLLLSEHLNRLDEIGINVPLWDFLANDVQSDQASVRFDETALRDLADELRSQSAEFLATAETFVSDEINQFQSMQIFAVFRQRGVIDENGTVTPEYAKASGLVELSRDPTWQADLAALAVKLNWRAELDSDMAARPHWRLDLYQSLGDLGLTSSLSEQILQKLQGHGLIGINGLVLVDTINDAALREAFTADRVQGLVKLPEGVSLSAIRQLLMVERAGQQAILQTVREKLLVNGFVDANGLILKETIADFNDQILRDMLGGDEPLGVHILLGVRDALSRYKTIQDRLGGVLLSLRQAYDSAVLVALSTLLGADADLTQVVIEYFKDEMPPARFLNLMLKLEDDQPIPAEIAAIPSPETDTPPGYLYTLSKLLLLAAQFELAATEMVVLLAEPATLDVKNALRPDLDDLDNLSRYRRLRQSFEDTEGKLLSLCQSEDRFSQLVDEARRERTLDDIGALTGWDRRQLGTLVKHFGRAVDYNRVTGLSKLKQGFDLAQSIRADVEFLIALADTRSLDYAFYRHQADALLNVLRAQYDEERWPKIYKPIRDALAVRKRDALLSLAMLKIPTEFEGRRSPDILSEYLLIDTQTGSEVDASRIQQAIAAVQLYVQRCQMNLEKDVDPAWILPEQWEWMKNYRVWEANRKVFLYPENYIEPELRDTKSPLFEELEQELMQSDISQESAEQAYINYLDKFREIANLKIVGSYLHKEFDPDATGANAVKGETLYLVGRTNTQPAVFYYREHIKTHKSERWLPWKKIDLTINAEFVTPVYAFNKLFLFWSEFIKQKKSVQRQLSSTVLGQYGVDFLNKVFTAPVSQEEINTLEAARRSHQEIINSARSFGPFYPLVLAIHQPIIDDLDTQITNKRSVRSRQQAARRALVDELAKADIRKLDEKKWNIDSEGYLFDKNMSERVEKSIDVYNTNIKYSYFNFSKTWIQSQVYAELQNELEIDLYRQPQWQRIYAQQTLQLSSQTAMGAGARQTETNVAVLQVDENTDIKADIPDFGPNQLTWSFWTRFENRLLGGVSGWDFTHHAQWEKAKKLLPQDLSGGITAATKEKIGQILTAVQPTEIDGDSLEKSMTLLDYAQGKLRVTATNVVTAFAGRQEAETAAINASTKTREALINADAALTQANSENFAEAETAAAAAETAAGEAKALADLGGFHDAAQLAQLAAKAETQAQAAKGAAKTAQAAQDAVAKAGDKKAAKEEAAQAAIAAKSTAKTAKDSAVAADEATQVARVIEQLTPKWESKNTRLLVEAGQPQEMLSVNLDYHTWQHLALSMAKNDKGYEAKLYHYRAGDAHTTSISGLFTTGALPRQERLVLGRQPAGVGDAFSTQMSEFRLWDSVRDKNTIVAQRSHRQTGQEPGLFHLALSVEPPGSTVELVTVTDLTFILPPVQLTRERIILIYGHNNTVKSIRNNLEDQSFDLALEASSGDKMYDVKLSREAGSAIDSPKAMLHLTQASGLSFRDFATGDQKLVVRALVNSSPSNTEKQDYLVRKIQEVESTYMDVNNQPGWFIVDTGDEQFLVKALLADPAQPIPTTRERMLVRYNDDAVTDYGSAQALAVSFVSIPNDPLIVAAGKAKPRFKFERLSTFAVHELSLNLFKGGIDSLLSLESQQAKEPDFWKLYSPNIRLVPAEDNRLSTTIDFRGAYRLYYEEIFFHIPFLIANQLNGNQQFTDAQKWYHYIFDPTTQETAVDSRNKDDNRNRYWRYLPFRRFAEAETITEMLADPVALAAYREDPFDPHAIAGLRVFAYQKAVVMKYIDNLLDWGDSLFSQDTREAINEAVGLYIMAYNLLGPRPKDKPVKESREVGDYATIKNVYSQLEIPEFLLALETGSNSGNRPAASPNSSIITDFCLVENQQFIGYWDRVEDRLHKIRHSQNIEGVFRQLALFEPPIEPSLLVQAVAGGRSIGSALSGLGVPTPHYRYSFMLDRAKEMIDNVKDLGGALLSAIESRDAEKLALLENTHERTLLNSMTAVKEFEQQEADQTKEALHKSRQIIQERFNRFDRLISQNLTPEETAAIVLLGIGKGFKALSTGLKFGSSIAYTVPDSTVGGAGISSPVAVVTYGGGNIAENLSTAADVFNLLGEIVESAGELTDKMAEYDRRKDEWEHERTIAGFELEEIDMQIAMAELRRQITQRELSIHLKTIEQNQEIADFYRSKFSNQALYNWMIAKLSGLHFQAYRLAYNMAKSAEKALQYELPTTDSLISFGHWDSLKKGLLAGESLMLEVNRMEKYHLDNDSRFLEIEKSISMRREMPGSLLALIAGGGCEFQLSEEMFDRDYPGHYFRVIKTMAISVKVAVGPYQSVKATLVQVGSKALLEPSLDAVRYLMGDEGAEQPDGNVVRTNWRANQQIAISKTNEDYGMFVLDFFRDDRYFPFEGTGAVSSWRLEMPHETNPDIDFTQIEDAIIHLRYTSKSDSGKFREDVKGLIQSKAN